MNIFVVGGAVLGALYLMHASAKPPASPQAQGRDVPLDGQRSQTTADPGVSASRGAATKAAIAMIALNADAKLQRVVSGAERLATAGGAVADMAKGLGGQVVQSVGTTQTGQAVVSTAQANLAGLNQDVDSSFHHFDAGTASLIRTGRF